MNLWNRKKYAHYFNISKKIVLPQGVGKQPPTCGKTVHSHLLSQIVPICTTTIYCVPGNLECKSTVMQ